MLVICICGFTILFITCNTTYLIVLGIALFSPSNTKPNANTGSENWSWVYTKTICRYSVLEYNKKENFLSFSHCHPVVIWTWILQALQQVCGHSEMKCAYVKINHVLPLLSLEFCVFYSRCSTLSWVELLPRDASNLPFTLEGSQGIGASAKHFRGVT